MSRPAISVFTISILKLFEDVKQIHQADGLTDRQNNEPAGTVTEALTDGLANRLTNIEIGLNEKHLLLTKH